MTRRINRQAIAEYESPSTLPEGFEISGSFGQPWEIRFNGIIIETATSRRNAINAAISYSYRNRTNTESTDES